METTKPTIHNTTETETEKSSHNGVNDSERPPEMKLCDQKPGE